MFLSLIYFNNDLVSLDIIVNVIDAFVCLINQGLIIKLLYWRDVEPKNIDTRQILDLQFWPSCQSWIQFVLSELFNYCRFNRLGELGEVSFKMLKLGE